MAMMLLLVIKWQVLNQKRPWSYKAHVAFQDIEKLRKLIKTGGTKLFAKARQPYFIRKQISVFILLIRHGPELIHVKDLLILTRTGLFEKYRASELHPYKDSKDYVEPAKTYDDDQGYEYVQQAFNEIFIH